MKCSKCNAQIVPYGTYDPEAEFIPSASSLKVATVSSKRHEKGVYTCSNAHCENHNVHLNADGTLFNILS